MQIKKISILANIFIFGINFSYAVASGISNLYSHLTVNFIEQKLDHFDRANNKTWNMRYFSNFKYCDRDRPLFIVLGGPWSINPHCLIYGHFHDIAKVSNGCLFHTEHRYYGRSLPTSDLSLSNLKFLNVQQALADIQHFIRILKSQKDFANSKIILHGAAYAGSLVGWLKYLDPTLFDGGWISSAPLSAALDFEKYGEVLGKTIKQLGSHECYDRIQNGILELENKFSSIDVKEAKRLLHLGDSFNETNNLDIWFLFEEIALVFSNFLQGQEKDDVVEMCGSMVNSTNDMTAVIDFVLKRFGSPRSLNISYNKMINQMRNIDDFSGGIRQWYYQSCNEFGWYPTTSSSYQPFGTKVPIDLYLKVCTDVFRNEYSYSVSQEKINQINLYLGSDHLCNLTNIFLTYGELDPWNSFGCPMRDDRVKYISNTSHSKDLGPLSNDDSVDMKLAKEKVKQLISEWIRNPQHNS